LLTSLACRRSGCPLGRIVRPTFQQTARLRCGWHIVVHGSTLSIHTRTTHLANIGKKSVLALLINVGGATLAFATQILVARLTDAATYGLYVYTLSWVAIVGLVAVMGLDSLTIRVVGESDDRQSIKPYLHWAGWRLVLQIVCASVVALLVLQFGWVAEPMAGVLQAGVLLLAGTSALVVAQAAVQGHNVAHARWPNQLLRPIILAAIVVGLVVLKPQWITARGLVVASSVSVVIALLVVLVWLRRLVGADRPVASGGAHNQRKQQWSKSLWAMTFVASTSLLLSQTDIVLLGLFRSQDEVGVYGAAARIANLAGFGLVAVNLIVMPLLAQFYAQEDRSGIQSTLHASARLAVGFVLVIGSLLAWQAPWVLGLFGSEFVTGVDMLRILLVGQVVNAFAASSGSLMVMTGHERQAANVLAAVVVLNAIVSLVLIPLYGGVGAAAATAFSIALWSVLGLVFVHRRLRYRASIL